MPVRRRSVCALRGGGSVGQKFPVEMSDAKCETPAVRRGSEGESSVRESDQSVRSCLRPFDEPKKRLEANAVPQPAVNNSSVPGSGTAVISPSTGAPLILKSSTPRYEEQQLSPLFRTATPIWYVPAMRAMKTG